MVVLNVVLFSEEFSGIITNGILILSIPLDTIFSKKTNSLGSAQYPRSEAEWILCSTDYAVDFNAA